MKVTTNVIKRYEYWVIRPSILVLTLVNVSLTDFFIRASAKDRTQKKVKLVSGASRSFFNGSPGSIFAHRSPGGKGRR